MKINEYNQMMAHLTRPAKTTGGRVGLKTGSGLSKRQPPQVSEEMKKKIIEKMKGTLRMFDIMENMERTKGRVNPEGKTKAYGLNSGGRVGLKEGTGKSWINFPPTYDEKGNLVPTFSKTGKQQIEGAPEGITSDKEIINFIVNLDIPIGKKWNLLGDFGYGKFRDQIAYDDSEIFLQEEGGRSRKVGIGYNEEGDGFSGHVKYDVDSGEPEAFFKWSKKFNEGGRVGLVTGSGDYAKKYLKYKDKATQDKFNKLVNELSVNMSFESAISLALEEIREGSD